MEVLGWGVTVSLVLVVGMVGGEWSAGVSFGALLSCGL